jgi:2,4-dienoyl-CoA reductase (NADPH2)
MTILQHTIATPYMVGPVHCYTVEAKGELVLFDTGPPTDHARKYLREHVDLKSLRHVIITHCHIDHYGLASWLEEETEATIYLPYRDALKITQYDTRLDEMYQFLLGVGFDEDYLVELRGIFEGGLIFPPPPKRFRIIEDDLPRHLGIDFLSCPGHSQSDMVLTSGDWAVSGDVLLRGIFQSPLLDIDLQTGERFRNYDVYCDTLVKLATLRQKRIMPGHRERIESVDATILFYITKMLERVVQLRPYADDDNIARIIDRLFSQHMIETFLIYLKASEIVFMKDLLENPDRLRAALGAIGLFDAVASQFQDASGH